MNKQKLLAEQEAFYKNLQTIYQQTRVSFEDAQKIREALELKLIIMDNPTVHELLVKEGKAVANYQPTTKLEVK